MPVVVEILFVVLRMLDSGWVSTSDKVSDASLLAGGSVPQDLVGAGVEHGRRPNGENGMLRNKGAIIE